MSKSTYYVKFRNSLGVIQKEYFNARNCSRAVEKAKKDYNAESIIKSGKAINEKGHYRKMLGL